jgi:N-acyl-D-amino-acid deacylase
MLFFIFKEDVNKMSKLFILGGTLIDGTGSPGIRADIAVENDQIVEIAPVIRTTGQNVLDATGMIVAPGFIDIHSHTDASIFGNPFVESMLFQGVTTEVTGNCGVGIFPIEPERIEELEAYVKMHGFVLPEQGISWSNFSDYAATLEQLYLGINLAPLVGHGALRIAAMGSKNQPPSSNELTQMKLLLQTALEQGAWGLSVGLVYPPSSYANADELIELGKILAVQDALFTSHVRGESETLLEAIDEMIQIGVESSARIEVSHLKAIGQPYWGRGKLALDRIEKARQKGIQIGADQYPYEASSTVLSVLLPQWVHDGGVENLLRRLVAPELQDQIEAAVNGKITERGGASCIMVASVGSARNRQVAGKYLTEISALWECTPARAVIRLLVEERAIVSAIYFSISKDDLEYILANIHVAVASDGRGIQAEKNKDEAVHPRFYGTFSRILGKFVREKKLLSLENAIYKMTGLPAQQLKMTGRGLLRKGFHADIVVFDPNTVKDTAEFTDPHRYAVGMRYVIVNGQIVVEDGSLTGKAPGRVLRKK